jgi:hypothetical protein
MKYSNIPSYKESKNIASEYKLKPWVFPEGSKYPDGRFNRLFINYVNDQCKDEFINRARDSGFSYNQASFLLKELKLGNFNMEDKYIKEGQ